MEYAARVGAVVSAGVVGCAFAVAALTHARNSLRTRLVVYEYRLLPQWVPLRAAAAVLIAAEAAVPVLLLTGSPAGGVLAIALLGGFSVAIASAIVRDLNVDCGCGPGNERVGPRALARNAGLLAMSAAAVTVGGPLSLEPAVALGALLLIALAANAATVQLLRRSPWSRDVTYV